MQELPDLAVVEVVRDEDAAQAAERDERDHRKNALRDDEVAAAGLDAGHALRRRRAWQGSGAFVVTRRGLAREARTLSATRGGAVRRIVFLWEMLLLSARGALAFLASWPLAGAQEQSTRGWL